MFPYPSPDPEWKQFDGGHGCQGYQSDTLQEAPPLTPPPIDYHHSFSDKTATVIYHKHIVYT